MRPRSLVTACFAALLTLAAHADSAQDVLRMDSEISVATWSRDTVWFEENLADEFVLITPGGEVRTKRDVIRDLSVPSLKMEPYEPSEVSVRIYGDSAVVTGRVTQRFTIAGVRFVTELRYTDVYAYVRKKARWILVSGHSSKVSRSR